MKEIPDAAIVFMIQLIYEHVDPDKKKMHNQLHRNPKNMLSYSNF